MKKPKKKTKTGDEDLILLKKIIKNKCGPSFIELRDKHSNLFYSICNKFANRLDIQEIYKDKDFVFFKAVLSFKIEKKAKFSTWLGNFTRYHCLNYIKSNSKYVNTEESVINHFFDQKSVEDFAPVEEYKNDISRAFDILKKLNDKRIFRIFELRYLRRGAKLTWKDIAEKFELTPQTIINLHGKGRAAIKKQMDSKNIFKKG
jgi:RNA polymerase sigma factor (sigma-70 family)